MCLSKNRNNFAFSNKDEKGTESRHGLYKCMDLSNIGNVTERSLLVCIPMYRIIMPNTDFSRLSDVSQGPQISVFITVTFRLCCSKDLPTLFYLWPI
jgi:hypothetical protein